MKQKILFLIFIFFTMITLTSAESIKVSNYEELVTAISNTESKIEIELLNSININEKITITENKEVILNGQNHELKRGEYTGGYFVIPSTTTLTLNNITLDGGATKWSVDYNNQEYIEGGYLSTLVLFYDDILSNESLIKNNGTLNISNSSLKNAISNENGATINNTGTVNIINSEFSHNYANYGGAIYSAGGTINIKSTKFINNGVGQHLSGNGNGGAIYIMNGENIKISEQSLFENNFSQMNAGALFVDTTNVDVKDTIFKDNNVGNDGGAISLMERDNSKITYHTVSFNNVEFENNKAMAIEKGQSLGGAIVIPAWFSSYVQENNKLIFDNCKFNNNSSLGGGAISDYGSVKMIIRNSEFTNNKAYSGGGALRLALSKIQLENSLITNNEAKFGSAAVIIHYSELALNNTIINNNISSNSAAIYLNPYADGYMPSLYMKNNSIITNNKSDRGAGIVGDNREGRSFYVETDSTSKIYGNTATSYADDILILNDDIPTKDYYLDKNGFKILDAKLMNIVGIDGWYNDDENNRFKDSITPEKADISNIKTNKNISLKAAGQIELSYDLNGGSSDYTYETESTRYGTDFDIVTDEPTKNVAKFIGWNTEKDGSGHWYYAGDKYNGEYGSVLYAQYELVSQIPNPETTDTFFIIIILLLLIALSNIFFNKKLRLLK